MEDRQVSMEHEKRSTGEGTAGDDLARERLAFERERFAFEREIERAKLAEAKRSVWRSLIGPVVIGGLITAGVTVYGINIDRQTSLREQVRIDAADKRDEANRRSEILIQLVNARERAVTDLRSQMFSALLQHYFNRNDVEARITLLKLIGLNFRDSVQIKPLFEQLDSEIMLSSETPAAENAKAREMLRKAARSIIADQVEQIRQSRDGAVCELIRAQGERHAVECLQGLSVKLVEIRPDGVMVQSNTRNGFLLDTGQLEEGHPFWVGYYDMPMIDYTSVVAGRGNLWKYAIVLDGITEDKVAKLSVAVLPVDSYSPQYKYKFDEMLADYLEGVIK